MKTSRKMTQILCRGLEKELLQLVEQADLVVLDGRVIKHRDKKRENLYFYEGAMVGSNKTYVNITRYTSTLELLSVKVRCERYKYLNNGIKEIVDSIIENNDCVVNLDIV